MAVRVVGPLDPGFAWDGRTGVTADPCGASQPDAPWRGACACVHEDEHGARLFRDVLGLGKLFWGVQDGATLVAARLRPLVEAGIPLEAVRAVPPGVWAARDDQRRLAAPDRSDTTLQPDAAGRRIADTVRRYLEAVAALRPWRAVFACVSGGLDSSTVAVLARERFPGLTLVSFDLARSPARSSADRDAAERLARDLGLDLVPVTVGPDDLLDGLDTALVEGLDWRDFNVHAALVNVALARGIRAALPAGVGPEDALVLSGDLVNEYLVDYHTEWYRGVAYYALPRLEAPALQRALVRGLDTCHREIGPFAAAGVSLVQPFAPAVDHYLALSQAFLERPDRKATLCRAMVGDAVPAFVYARPKTRAQVGGLDDGGVLACCVERGLDAGALARRFAQLHGERDTAALPRLMRAGRYRAAVPILEAA